MKIFASFLLAAALLVLQAQAHPHPKTGSNTEFRCDVPDEWLFGNNTPRNFWPGAKWPGAVVKYELHGSLNDNDRNEVHRAFNDIQAKTCIRFEPRANGEAAYTSIEVDDNVCGLGHLCRTGGYQFAQFGGGCREWNTMVHELGHNLCLGHEQSRKDRDDYVHFDGCPGNEIPGKDMDSDLRGSIYDYASQMHYQCGWCPGGWPKEGGGRCGRDIQNGLSILDADKLNDFYDCGGCMGHRWKPIDGLNDDDRRNLLKLGETDWGMPLFACRAQIGGQIAIGKYSAEQGVCYLPFNGGEHQYGNRAQVLTWPSGFSTDGESTTKVSYKVANVTDLLTGKTKAGPIASGRTVDGITAYIAVARIEFEGRWENSIGKVFENDWSRAYFPFAGRELQTSEFGIIICE